MTDEHVNEPSEDTRTPRDEEELERRLSTPSVGVVQALARCPGDILILGAGGKLGPSLAAMIRRAVPQDDPRRVIAVSRFSDNAVASRLQAVGVETVRADLQAHGALAALPSAPNIFFLAGQKFGTSGAPSKTWAANAILPSFVTERFRGVRFVALSTGNVYRFTPVTGGGSTETDVPGPVGEYAWSCLARERVFEHAATAYGTQVAIVRLNYAVDLRYGVLVDVAQRVAAGTPIDLRMGHVNVIWQGDACARIIQCLPHAATPPFVLNVTGPDTLSIRSAAMTMGRMLGREPVFSRTEGSDALLSNSARATGLFGSPSVSTDTLIRWAAEWVARGGRTLGKPTHFEEREGAF